MKKLILLAVPVAILGIAITRDYRFEILDPSGRDMKRLTKEVCYIHLNEMKPLGPSADEATVDAAMELSNRFAACSEAVVWQVYELRRGRYGERVPRVTNWLAGGRTKVAVFDLSRLSTDSAKALYAITKENKPYGCTFENTCLGDGSDWF
jgi:hypothetical protein